MKKHLSDSLLGVRLQALLLALTTSTVAAAAEPPPPPAGAARLPEAVALPTTQASMPEPEPETIKVRLHGEYELRQSFLSALPLGQAPPNGGDRERLAQTSRLFHWMRLRGRALFGERAELRIEADAPHGLVYGEALELVPDSGTDFERIQPVRATPRMLRLTLRSQVGEVSLGHTTTQLGLGLVDADGDQPRWFGIPYQPATYERVQLLSGSQGSTLRVGAAADLLFKDGVLSLLDGDRLLRVGLSARYAPNPGTHLDLLARYESLAQRDARRGAQLVVLDLSGGLRRRIPGSAGEVFADFEAVYRVGAVNEPTAFAVGDDQALAAGAFATRAGVALEREHDLRRFAHLVASLEWGMASGDADPSDDELHRFVMNPNHGVGLILFSEILRFKSARSQAQRDFGSEQRLERASTRGGVAGATYLNPVLAYRPLPDLTLKVGAVVASATSAWVDPVSVESGSQRSNFDGGSPFNRSLGREIDVGIEHTLALEPPTLARLSLEGALAFPGSAFDDAEGHHLGTQKLLTAGLGLTF